MRHFEFRWRLRGPRLALGLTWIWLWAAGWGAGALGAEAVAPGASDAARDLPAASPRDPAAPPRDLAPGPDAGHIAQFTARLLMTSHYTQRPFDDELSARFLDQYLDTLDPTRLVFTKADVEELEPLRHRLDDLILRAGDTRPAYLIFKRFLERYDQMVAFALETLRTNSFAFDTDEQYRYNRREQARPRDLEESRQLWLQRIRYEYLQEKLNQEVRLDKPAGTNALSGSGEITNTIARRYTRVQRFFKEYEQEDVLQAYLNALAHVYDPQSDYMGASAFENFNIHMKLSLFGIGAQLRSEDGYCKIMELVPGGPAEQSKRLKPNDRIIAVAQADGESVDVVDMKLDRVVQLIRGPKGTVVRLTIIPADAADPSVRRTVTLVRDEIKLEEREAKARIVELPGTHPLRLGIVDLPSFYAEMGLLSRPGNPKSTTADVSMLIRKLVQEKVSGVILDLRRNGGGSLEEAIRLTGLFIPEGPVVQVKDPDGSVTVDEDTDPSILYAGPLVVLTSRFSASASEILAGALQNYGRALIVGDSSTHGKGTVQNLIQLEPLFARFGIEPAANPGALKLTIRKFYLPNGWSTQLRGVVPDIVFPSLNNHDEIGESALPNALPWDSIPRVPFRAMNTVQPYRERLQQRSLERVQADPDFAYLQAEIQRLEKALSEKSVSMNEARRRQEKAEADARSKAHQEDLRRRPAPEETVYEITLKQADLPGLPPPLSPTNSVARATEAGDPLDPPDPDSVDPEDAVPDVDAALREAQRILRDWIQMDGGSSSIAGRPANRR